MEDIRIKNGLTKALVHTVEFVRNRRRYYEFLKGHCLLNTLYVIIIK